MAKKIGRPKGVDSMGERALVRHSAADRAIYKAEVERLTKLTGRRWTVSGYLRVAGLAYAGKHLAGVVVVVAMLLATSTASADTRFELDNLLPLVEQPVPLLRPRSDHSIDMLTTATERRHDRLWQAIDIATLAVSTASLACDWGQTHRSAANHWTGTYEKNPILGASPSTASVNAYFAIAAVANVALWLALPKRYRSLVSVGLIAVQAETIGVAVATHASTMCGL